MLAKAKQLKFDDWRKLLADPEQVKKANLQGVRPLDDWRNLVRNHLRSLKAGRATGKTGKAHEVPIKFAVGDVAPVQVPLQVPAVTLDKVGVPPTDPGPRNWLGGFSILLPVAIVLAPVLGTILGYLLGRQREWRYGHPATAARSPFLRAFAEKLRLAEQEAVDLPPAPAPGGLWEDLFVNLRNTPPRVVVLRAWGLLNHPQGASGSSPPRWEGVRRQLKDLHETTVNEPGDPLPEHAHRFAALAFQLASALTGGAGGARS